MFELFQQTAWQCTSGTLQELILVMVVAPSILNPIWSWIIDNLVKDRNWPTEQTFADANSRDRTHAMDTTATEGQRSPSSTTAPFRRIAESHCPSKRLLSGHCFGQHSFPGPFQLGSFGLCGGKIAVSLSKQEPRSHDCTALGMLAHQCCAKSVDCAKWQTERAFCAFKPG